MLNDGKANLLLNRQAGWGDATLDRVVLADGGAALQLRALPGHARPLVDAQGSFGGLTLPLGLGVDGQDRVYILDGGAGVVKRFDPCSQRFETLPCIGGVGSGPRRLRDPRGMTVSRRNDLCIADTGNRRVQVFALKGLALRHLWGPLRVIRSATEIRVVPTQAVWPLPETPDRLPDPVFTADTWQPYDIVVSETGRAYVSDYANGLIHIFDAAGDWRKAIAGTAPDDGASLQKPTRLALDTQSRLYVVQEGRDYVVVLDADGNYLKRLEPPDSLAGTSSRRKFCPVAVAVDRDGNLILCEDTTRQMHLFCPTPEGGYAYASACGKGTGQTTALIFDRQGDLLRTDAAGVQTLSLSAQAAFETEGIFYSGPLDSRIYRCLWHRVRLHACIPLGTQVQIDTLTSESLKTAAEIVGLPESRWATGQIDAQIGAQAWDCLLQSPPGRYLWLRLTLRGEGTVSPTIAQARLYFPRNSSLQFLPAVFQEDQISADFMGRFLSIFDNIQGGIADQITQIARLFDPGAAPAGRAAGERNDFLAWLASWLGLTLDRHWPEAKRRRLLKEAHRLYALRGTPEGLRLHLALYLDADPHILEHYKLRRWLFLGSSRLGDASALWGQTIVSRLQLGENSRIGQFQLAATGDAQHDPFDTYAHRFTVFVPKQAGFGATQQQTLERIVAMAKPAHTLGKIELTTPRMRVGIQSFIGVDTFIGAVPDAVIAGAGKLGYDTVLGPADEEVGPPALRIGMTARIGSSAL